MLTKMSIEAQLADPDAADQVWEAWDEGHLNTLTAFDLWRLLAAKKSDH